MLKRLVLILSFLSLPVFAGTFEDAMKTNNYVFLYLYTSDCGYCKRFLPIYEKLAKTETGVKFVKVDAQTLYGYNLMRNFRASYVPFVILVNSKTKSGAQIPSDCILQLACAQKAIKEFKK